MKPNVAEGIRMFCQIMPRLKTASKAAMFSICMTEEKELTANRPIVIALQIDKISLNESGQRNHPNIIQVKILVNALVTATERNIAVALPLANSSFETVIKSQVTRPQLVKDIGHTPNAEVVFRKALSKPNLLEMLFDATTSLCSTG